MKKNIILLLAVVALVMSGCDEFLDRPSLTTMDDSNYWTSENNLRLFANGFYQNYFVGYNSGWGVDYTPLRGYYFADDFTSSGKQGGFETQAPASRYSTSESAAWLTTYAGPTWNFSWVRKSNLFIERIENMKDKYLSDNAYKHWSAVARFFRGYEYSRLVSVFGDVPYYDKVVGDDQLDLLYKDRDPRTMVMDKVYDDFVYVLENMALSDGNNQYLNRYIAAGFISRFMLFEGTWQKYHLNNTEKAKKFLELAVTASNLVVSSGKYSFASDFRSLFGSMDLAANKEVIMYRHYDAALGVTHHVASYSNTTESQVPAPNLSLAKAFICKDGKPWKLSSLANADKLDIKTMVATRDPRFEATFWDAPLKESATLLYACKFIDRVGPTYYGKTYPAQYGSNTNTNDYPVMRLAEVVLNWIEAKAELATIGGSAVAQADIDASINAIRSRPLDGTAIAKGITKTAPLTLAALPDDPDRDPDVPALLWEIRRERRMEFVYEHTRLMDIKRWKKINYMNGTANPDNLLGLWINFQAEFPEWLVAAKVDKLKVKKADGTVVTYNGSNAADMVGYYIPENVSDRDPFTDRVYMAPVGNTQISEYLDKGFKLTQTTGW
ncbi:MAG TPA: RagB/SusD family nutrient uptake outer membrane protein [Prolixibacteraceae bacterium]|nr:MAG: SusD family protein [Bacteroidetes bacterium ADurb.Bin123]HPV18906.1 RagB/SusD family nutrient uptake outer membrane protein [Prolixibacteraceae bacterium]